MFIDDGTGKGKKAGVTDNNQLLVAAVNRPEFLFVNVQGDAFVWDFPAYNYSGGDTVMWLRNDSNENLHIHHIYLYTDTSTVATLHAPVNVTPAGTSVTGLNLNLTSGETPEATAYQNETVSVTGPVLHTEYASANEPLTILKEEGYEIILGKNDVIAVNLTTVGASTFGHIVGYYGL